ncbi:MAG: prepilin-type N-terminal cleavage/methylation domain-containing protein [Planococcus sp. (in: firmicutes)]|uniref:prepilin-type N-terminal cleavage/methylation domain-containing protein n=1 Tax=Planococcus halocryophilus TaxID=1215089 RepID=UPI001F0E2C7D|nr:prepilin-type N-terminal cleavage/methylation domain-containing protein [Planococcus halocryophilus]MCH4825625.1 prepilin-type N-terminal cleavage/methylation domain-containing protein [Planococcus halocryophilus]
MKKFLQNKLNNEKGMTLIELLAVIVIIAIIAAIAIPAIGNIIENSRVGAIKSDALNVIAASNLYYADNPDVTTSVLIKDLASASGGYLKDAASFTTDTTAAVTPKGLITGKGTIAKVEIDFSGADKIAINSVSNNTKTAGTNSGKGTGTVTVTRK